MPLEFLSFSWELNSVLTLSPCVKLFPDNNKKNTLYLEFADLRDDKQFFIDHPGAVPITTNQVCNLHNLIFFQTPSFFLSDETSLNLFCLQGEELKKLIGSPVYIECSSKTQQVPYTHYLSDACLFVCGLYV